MVMITDSAGVLRSIQAAASVNRASDCHRENTPRSRPSRTISAISSASGGITINGSTLALTNATNQNLVNRVADAAAITSYGGGLTWTNTAGAGVVYAETLGTVALGAGQFDVNLATNQASGVGNAQTLTLAGLTRSGTGAVTFSAPTTTPNATTNIVRVTGATQTASASTEVGAVSAEGRPGPQDPGPETRPAGVADRTAAATATATPTTTTTCPSRCLAERPRASRAAGTWPLPRRLPWPTSGWPCLTAPESPPTAWATAPVFLKA